MLDLTPELVAAAIDVAWDSVVATMDRDIRARVTGTQAELASWLAYGFANQLGLPVLDGPGRRASARPSVRWDPGDPDLARPARLWIVAGDPTVQHELARARWLPRSLYRALGFLLHSQRDATALAKARRSSASPHLPWVFLMDPVGVIEQKDVDLIAVRGSPIRTRAWTLRHGELSSRDTSST